MFPMKKINSVTSKVTQISETLKKKTAAKKAMLTKSANLTKNVNKKTKKTFNHRKKAERRSPNSLNEKIPKE